jgi:PAS domain S-box-containing protein
MSSGRRLKLLSHPVISNNFAATVDEPALIVTPQGRIAALNSSFKTRFRVEDEDLCGFDLAEMHGDFMGGEATAELKLTLPGLPSTISVVAEALSASDLLLGYRVLLAGAAAGTGQTLAKATGLQDVLDALPSGVTVWDPNGSLLMANKKVVELYQECGIELRPGVDRLEISEAALRAGIFGNRYRGFDAVVDRWLGHEREHRGSTVVERLSDNGWIKISTQILESGCIVSLYDEMVAPAAGGASPRDTAEYFGSLLRFLPGFVVHIGIDGRPEFVNDACAAAIGMRPEEIVGRSGLRFFEDAFCGPIQDMIRELKPGSPPFTFDQRWRRPDGNFVWLRWSSQGLFDGDELVGFVASGRDISIEYDQQQALKHQSDDLEKKNKSLEQFAAVVSHDLKAPLRHVSVFADMIVEEAAKGNLADVQIFAEQVRTSAQRMDRIIRRLLEYSQIAYKIVSISRVNLAEIAIQAIQNLESQVEESRAELLLSKLPDIDGDPDLIRHLLQNLIANAVKYSRKGSVPRVRIYATETGSTVNLIIEDHGIGIDPKFADRIFTAFQRLHTDDKVYEGFGVGLALCKQIAESHRGSIELDTSYSDGARFIVRLPKHLNI